MYVLGFIENEDLGKISRAYLSFNTSIPLIICMSSTTCLIMPILFQVSRSLTIAKSKTDYRGENDNINAACLRHSRSCQWVGPGDPGDRSTGIVR